MKGLIGPPVIQLHQLYKPVELGLFEIILRLLGHVQTDYPAARIGHLFEPLFVIIFVATMKIQHILRDQNELGDAGLEEFIGHFPLQVHDIILNGVIPLDT